MRCLSLWQPHAEAIALGIKPYETRGWETDVRGPVAIHASRRPFNERSDGYSYFAEVSRRLAAAGCRVGQLDYGKVVCVADLVDCVPAWTLQDKIGDAEFWGDFNRVGDDGKHRFAFKLENVRAIPRAQRPLVTGRQGWFEVDNEIGLWA